MVFCDIHSANSMRRYFSYSQHGTDKVPALFYKNGTYFYNIISICCNCNYSAT